MKWLCRLLVGVSVALLPAAARGQEYRVGVGRADITPRGPIWMSGYGSRNKPSEGVEQHLFTKALTIRHGGDRPVILVTADLIGFRPYVTEPVAERLEKEFHVPRQNILFVGSHTHTGPVIYSGLEEMFSLKGRDAEAVKSYALQLREHCYKAAADALRDVQPARLSLGRGRASFAMNRRVFTPRGVDFGANPDGPVDRDVPVLRVDDRAGHIRAIVFGYACHCTTLGGDYYRICGDWAGYAQDFLERGNPGATAFFVTGCGGDANPEPRTGIELARQHGLEMAGAVARVLKGPRTPVAGPIKAVLESVDLPLGKPPSRGEFEKRLHDRDVFVQRHARRQLQTLDEKGKLPASHPCPVQVWQFGKDLTLVAMGGEVVVDYDLRLKRELKGGHLWVAGYANDVFAYIPSVRILLEGGYEADYNLIYYGLPTRFSNQVENTLIGKVHELVRKVRP
jgi:hypothetical protein